MPVLVSSVIVAIKMIGIFLGVLARSLAPYLRKLREGKIKSFHRRHLVSSIGSLVLGIIITLLIFPQFQAAAPAGSLSESMTRGERISSHLDFINIYVPFQF